MADRYRREHEDLGRRSEGRGSVTDAARGARGPSEEEDERGRHIVDPAESRFEQQEDRRSGDRRDGGRTDWQQAAPRGGWLDEGTEQAAGASGERGRDSQSSSGPSPSRTRDGSGSGTGDVGGGRPDGRGQSPLQGGVIRPMFGENSPRQVGTFAGRGPKGYQRSEERIREDISDQLTEAPDVDASDITVEVSGGEVTLTGTISDRSQKRRAEEIVEGCSGVSDVINHLRVQTPSVSFQRSEPEMP